MEKLPIKIWTQDGGIKKLVVASSYEALLQKGNVMALMFHKVGLRSMLQIISYCCIVEIQNCNDVPYSSTDCELCGFVKCIFYSTAWADWN